ncbi:MAG: glycosyltransferase family 39 protein [Polyangiaceae bacterium]
MSDAGEAQGTGPRDRGALLVPLAALAIAAAFLFAPLRKLGIWDPYELDAADLARRIAIWVFPHPSTAEWQAGLRAQTADPLWLPGAQNDLPTLSDLHMGELPYTSMALSFRLFGLHEWSARVPLALWGLAGALAVYALVARLVDRRAGLYATTALVTMPLYFLHARTMLGDIVTMASLALALAGLAGALLDRGALVRAAWGLTAIAGLVSGALTRGVLIGVAVPALSVGLGALVVEAGALPVRKARGRDLAGAITAGLALGAGAFAAWLGLVLLRSTDASAPLVRALGVSLLLKPKVESTFDLPLRDLGHALFPWSAFLPFAVGRMFRAPAIEGESPAAATARERELGLRAILLCALGIAFATFAMLGPRTGPLPFSGPAILAIIAALAIRDFERGAPPSRALAVAVPVLAYVLYTDLSRAPEKALSAFALDRPAFPRTFEEPGTMIMRWALAIFAGLLALAWFEAIGPTARHDASGSTAPQNSEKKSLDAGTPLDAGNPLDTSNPLDASTPRDEIDARDPTDLEAWARARVDGYIGGLTELSRVWAGNLVFVAVVLEAALVGLAAMVFFGRRFGWAPVERLPKLYADIAVNVWWALPLTAFAAPIVFVIVRDGFRAFVKVARVPRALATVLAALLAGGALSFGYYPALASQLSPKEAFESLARLSKPGEPLGLLGVRAPRPTTAPAPPPRSPIPCAPSTGSCPRRKPPRAAGSSSAPRTSRASTRCTASAPGRTCTCSTPAPARSSSRRTSPAAPPTRTRSHRSSSTRPTPLRAPSKRASAASSPPSAGRSPTRTAPSSRASSLRSPTTSASTTAWSPRSAETGRLSYTSTASAAATTATTRCSTAATR